MPGQPMEEGTDVVSDTGMVVEPPKTPSRQPSPPDNETVKPATGNGNATPTLPVKGDSNGYAIIRKLMSLVNLLLLFPFSYCLKAYYNEN